MSDSLTPRRPSRPGLLATAAVAELRRTAPETRAVLAGLLLVLGAWVGPGLSETEAPRAMAGQATETSVNETGAEPLAGEAYRKAVATARADATGPAEDRLRLADDED
jgi:hypothetical protein